MQNNLHKNIICFGCLSLLSEQGLSGVHSKDVKDAAASTDSHGAEGYASRNENGQKDDNGKLNKKEQYNNAGHNQSTVPGATADGSKEVTDVKVKGSNQSTVPSMTADGSKEVTDGKVKGSNQSTVPSTTADGSKEVIDGGVKGSGQASSDGNEQKNDDGEAKELYANAANSIAKGTSTTCDNKNAGCQDDGTKTLEVNLKQVINLTSSNSFSDNSFHNIQIVKVKKEQGVSTSDTKEMSKDKDAEEVKSKTAHAAPTNFAPKSSEDKYPESNAQHEECEVIHGTETQKQKKGVTNGVGRIERKRLSENKKGLEVKGILYGVQILNGKAKVLEDVTLVVSKISEADSDSRSTENGNEN
jgi:DNA-binding transcriptional MerR regulator